ncbi:I78 family peptidase inhibitor [Celeribacter indicus]|uniref:Peptidase inhibitor I78 family protein n=1 Tax=Celeribacter indicus TaxID=1208324 RepID=A0A0B5DWY5_9RHOB|nr:I78 family peptidase inhibitor [Celeribacter indicus]AJE45246.1 hypothetical protein P73_0531 [Celeribacter indicus]SDX21631.1 Peptidase inhibitor I78 family protein [Celeribacter indicus]
MTSTIRCCAFVLGAFALSACQEEETAPVPETEPPAATEDSCGMDRVEGMVGQDRAAVDALALEGPVRILPPGSMMTMDHRIDRLNIELDDAGKVTRIWCG